MDTRFLNLKSADRDSGTSVDFKYTLARPVNYPKIIKLFSAEIPLMICNTRTNYNTFTWTESTTSYTATVTAGNYSIADLLTALGAAMKVLTTNTYTFSKSDTTQRISVTSTNSIEIGSTNLTKALGFVSGQTGASITATNSFSINIWDTYYGIQLNVGSNYDAKSSFYNFKIPISVDSGYIQYYSAGTAFAQHCDLDIDKLAYLQVRLVDSFGNVCDLGGVDWSCTLAIVYDAFTKQ